MSQATVPEGPQQSPPPRRFRRLTSTRARFVDRLMTVVITTGGWAVVGAFATMLLFLAYVTWPLFKPADIQKSHDVVLTSPTTRPSVAALHVDEYLTSTWAIDSQGMYSSYHLNTGKPLSTVNLVPEGATATSVRQNREHVGVGLSDGRVRVGTVKTDVEYVPYESLDAGFKSRPEGESIVVEDAALQRSPGTLARKIRMKPELAAPVAVGDGASPIVLFDFFETPQLGGVLALREDGKLLFTRITIRKNEMTGEIRRRPKTFELPALPAVAGARAKSVLLGLNGRLAYVIFTDGTTVRYNLDEPEKAFVAETTSLIRKPGRTIVSATMHNGNATLIVGDSGGGVSGWFAAQIEIAAKTDAEVAALKARHPDLMQLVEAHQLKAQATAVTAIATSGLDRQFITTDAQGQIYVRHMTSGTLQATFKVPAASNESAANIAAVAFSPKNDAILALENTGRLTMVNLQNPHPEGSLAQMFLPIHYEGYAAPAHVYQSSAGTTDAEMKIGLWPLIFGTLKATFYAMLFAVPIAICAAIYTSEFMSPGIRGVVKPTIELMASLPSVVLGFIGALVVAPIVEGNVTAVVLICLGLPLGFVLIGYVWQLLPQQTRTATPNWVKFALMIVSIFAVMGIAWAFQHTFDRVVFGGEFKAWLNGRGSATPGWTLLLSPIALVAISISFNIYLRPRMSFYRTVKGELAMAMLELIRFLLFIVIAVLLASGLGLLFTAAGFDPRGPLVGPYVQRNSLLVGLFMGFAIIPIIYTVSEDALSRVPNALRSASLGLGATRWQMTIGVVLPVATSGIFAACMIGFGRAVGETMIVLMMSGRTPVTDINIFNGLSALSANIATELPEAPVNSTHYRVLFFSAFLLFILTFIVNTAAETIRVRFRKRAANM